MQGCWGALRDDEHEVLGWGHGFLLGSVCPGCADLGTMRLSPWARAAHRTGVWQLAGGGAEEATSTLTLCCAQPSRVPLSVIPRTVARQVPLFMEFSRQEYWSGLPCPLSGDLPDSGVESSSPALLEDSLPLSHRQIHLLASLKSISQIPAGKKIQNRTCASSV